jgi:hypothetical protein
VDAGLAGLRCPSIFTSDHPKIIESAPLRSRIVVDEAGLPSGKIPSIDLPPENWTNRNGRIRSQA